MFEKDYEELFKTLSLNKEEAQAILKYFQSLAELVIENING